MLKMRGFEGRQFLSVVGVKKMEAYWKEAVDIMKRFTTCAVSIVPKIAYRIYQWYSDKKKKARNDV